MSLEALRERIDRIDAGIVRLLIARAATARRIGQEKARRASPIVDAGREDRVVRRVLGLSGSRLPVAALELIYRRIIRMCVRVQIEKTRSHARSGQTRSGRTLRRRRNEDLG
jgi:chorismate mutase